MTISRVENTCKPLILLGLQKNIKIISTQGLTVLTMSVIVHLEQGKREKKKSSSDSFKIDTSDFSDSANITKSKLLFYERRYDL